MQCSNGTISDPFFLVLRKKMSSISRNFKHIPRRSLNFVMCFKGTTKKDFEPSSKPISKTMSRNLTCEHSSRRFTFSHLASRQPYRTLYINTSKSGGYTTCETNAVRYQPLEYLQSYYNIYPK
jgi:hypothetical protein